MGASAEESAASELQRLGIIYSTDEEGHVDQISLLRAEDRPALGLLESFPKLTSLAIPCLDADDSWLGAIPELRHLTTLDLSTAPFTSSGLASLPNLPALEELNLFLTRVDDEGIAHLRRFRRLRELSIGSNWLTGQTFETLQELPSLSVLEILYVELTEDAINHLKRLGRLQRLEIHCDEDVILAGAAKRDLRESLPYCTVVFQEPSATESAWKSTLATMVILMSSGAFVTGLIFAAKDNAPPAYALSVIALIVAWLTARWQRGAESVNFIAGTRFLGEVETPEGSVFTKWVCLIIPLLPVRSYYVRGERAGEENAQTIATEYDLEPLPGLGLHWPSVRKTVLWTVVFTALVVIVIEMLQRFA